MNIVAYNANWTAMGGGEKYFCAAVQALADQSSNDVTLVLPERGVSPDHLREYFHVPLEPVRIVRNGRAAALSTLRSATRALLLSNWYPLPVDPKRSVYILQIPYGRINASRLLRDLRQGRIRECVKDLLRVSLLRTARRSAGTVVYSRFVQDILRRRHGITSAVIYPPIDDFLEETSKERIVLSVGRVFRGLYNEKRYDVLIDAFKELSRRLPGHGWEYWIVGSCGNDDASQKYLAELRTQAEGYPVSFHLNVDYGFLRSCYNRATIFWHAAGYGINEELFPERVEHFGMTTVEAMTARCIPVVVNSGGQREIVAEGPSGYLWSTQEELLSATRALMLDLSLATRMGESARKRSAEFHRSLFAQQFVRFFSQYEVPAHDAP